MPTVKIILVFLLLGPPLGSLVHMLGLFVISPPSVSAMQAVDFFLRMTVIGTPFSYLFGVIPALGTGISMALVQRIWGRIRLIEAALLGLACGVLFAFATEQNSGPLPSRAYFVVKVLTCLIPTIICWWLVRSKRTDISEEGNEAVQR